MSDKLASTATFELLPSGRASYGSDLLNFPKPLHALGFGGLTMWGMTSIPISIPRIRIRDVEQVVDMTPANRTLKQVVDMTPANRTLKQVVDMTTANRTVKQVVDMTPANRTGTHPVPSMLSFRPPLASAPHPCRSLRRAQYIG